MRMFPKERPFLLKVGSLFCVVLITTAVAPFFTRFLRVEYEFRNFNLSRIICQENDTVLSSANENCLNALKQSLYDHEIYHQEILIHSIVRDTPIAFDSRQKWPGCPSINHIRDQGACGSCWAVSVASAVEDRLCIHSKGEVKVRISEEDLLSCCTECGSGCEGGNALEAWKYWKTHGVVSSFDYKSSKTGCRSYSIPPCDYFTAINCSHYHPTPACVKSCARNYSKTYEEDLYFGQMIYSIIADEKQIMIEVMTNGPVQAQMALYKDFMNYESGVYAPSFGVSLVSQHSVKIIGWGTDGKTGLDYWLITNSFNRHWGERGFLRMKRGDTCNIQSNIYAGIPRLKYHFQDMDVKFDNHTENRSSTLGTDNQDSV